MVRELETIVLLNPATGEELVVNAEDRERVYGDLPTPEEWQAWQIAKAKLPVEGDTAPPGAGTPDAGDAGEESADNGKKKK